MGKIEDIVNDIRGTARDIWKNQTVKDFVIIGMLTAGEQVTENIVIREIHSKYQGLARAAVNAGSNGAAYLLGKSQGEKYGPQSQSTNPSPAPGPSPGTYNGNGNGHNGNGDADE